LWYLKCPAQFKAPSLMLCIKLGANIPYEDEVWEECWQTQLTSHTATELLTFIGESSAVLKKLKHLKVINDAEWMNLTLLSKPLEVNTLFFQILGSKSIDNVRTAIQAFRPGQGPVADILDGMLIQALKEMSSKVAKVNTSI
jgi:hypothetical protein